mgnify:CR=1 FL=1
MSILSSATSEIRRSPISTFSGAFGVLIAALGLFLAWSQNRTVSPLTPTNSIQASQLQTAIELSNVLIIISYFLSSTIVGAIAIRSLSRKHDITSFFASIPLVALINFSTILVIYLAPPRAMSAQLFTSAHDIVLYSSVAIYIAMCGAAVLRDLYSTGRKKYSDTEGKNDEKEPDGLAFIVLGFILLAIWSSVVFAGQKRLTQTFLPEITHPIEVKATKDTVH